MVLDCSLLSVIQHPLACFISLWSVPLHHFCLLNILYQPLSSTNQIESSCVMFNHGTSVFLYAYYILFIPITWWFPNSPWLQLSLILLAPWVSIFIVHTSIGIMNLYGLRNSWSNSTSGYPPCVENDTSTELNAPWDTWASSFPSCFLSPLYIIQCQVQFLALRLSPNSFQMVLLL